MMHKKKMDDGSYLLVGQHISKRENQVAAQSQSQNAATIQSSMRKTFESNLFVKNIPSDIAEQEIQDLFEELGPVISLKMRQGKYFNPSAAYRQYFVLYKDIECAKRAIQRFDQSTPFGARPLSVQFWMPTNELHQEREQRSFQEVQQYFMKSFTAGQDRQFGMQGGMGQSGYRQGGNFQGQRGGPRPDRRDNKFNNNRGGPRNMRQGGNREGYQQQVPAQQPVAGTAAPEQLQQVMGQTAAVLPPVDVARLQAMEPNERRQEIGNTIYQYIQQHYGNAAGKITGMLLDNDRIVDSIQLVSNMQYLQQKMVEAWTLLQQQQFDPATVQAQAGAPT